MPEQDEPKSECVQALHELYFYIDGELTEERRLTIRQHLDDCPPCIEAYDFEAELRQVISVRCRDSVPDSLRQRIAQALGSERADADPGGRAD
jgi:mycothiol system anti-sigma-R factor